MVEFSALTKEELAMAPDVALAVLCGKIADAPEEYLRLVGEKAHNFKTAWAKLQTSPTGNYTTDEKNKALREELHKLMVDFLYPVA